MFRQIPTKLLHWSLWYNSKHKIQFHPKECYFRSNVPVSYRYYSTASSSIFFNPVSSNPLSKGVKIKNPFSPKSLDAEDESLDELPLCSRNDGVGKQGSLTERLDDEEEGDDVDCLDDVGVSARNRLWTAFSTDCCSDIIDDWRGRRKCSHVHFYNFNGKGFYKHIVWGLCAAIGLPRMHGVCNWIPPLWRAISVRSCRLREDWTTDDWGIACDDKTLGRVSSETPESLSRS